MIDTVCTLQYCSSSKSCFISFLGVLDSRTCQGQLSPLSSALKKKKKKNHINYRMNIQIIISTFGRFPHRLVNYITFTFVSNEAKLFFIIYQNKLLFKCFATLN